jgi:protein arginine kinase
MSQPRAPRQECQRRRLPGWAKKAERIKTLEVIRPAVEALPQMTDSFSEKMDNLTLLDKNILVERHLISREHAAKNAGSGLVVNRDETLCVMINEEDHLRVQALRPGLQLKQAWQAIDGVDSRLENGLEYAFSPELGYLTACPTNLGHRHPRQRHAASPGLVSPSRSTKSSRRQQLGSPCAVSTAKAPKRWQCLPGFNQMTLGRGGTRHRRAAQQGRSANHGARGERPRHAPGEEAQVGLQPHRPRLWNPGQCAQHFLQGDHEPAFPHASRSRSGPVLRTSTRSLVDELFVVTQPNHLQKRFSDKLTAEERDLLRADMLRERLRGVSRPRPKPLGPRVPTGTNRPASVDSSFKPRSWRIRRTLPRPSADSFLIVLIVPNSRPATYDKCLGDAATAPTEQWSPAAVMGTLDKA